MTLRRCTAALITLLAGALGAGAQTLDHLKCYRTSDSLKLRALVDIDTPQFGLDVGCKVSRARFLCTPALKSVRESNVTPIMLRGQDLRDDRICYRVKCPPPFPPGVSVTDQFGHRPVRKLQPALLCTSAVPGEPPVPMPGDPAVGDHLMCYKMKDPARVRGVVDLDSRRFGLEEGCGLKSARLLCVPGSATVRQANVEPLLEVGGSTLDDDRLCYRVRCAEPFPPSQEMTDPFGHRTLEKLRPRLLCTPAVKGVPTTTTTSTTTTTTFPENDPTIVCQRAIERGGMRYAEEVLGVVADCAAPGQGGSITGCVTSAPMRARLDGKRTEWGTEASPVCAGVELRRDLGYFETCGAPPSSCIFASTVLDLPGGTNDVLDCLACRLTETLSGAGVKLYADRAESNICHGAIGRGLDAVRSLLQQTDGCVKQPGATSLAACFTPDLAAWRAQAEMDCMGRDPFASPGYPSLCAGVSPVSPAFCALHAYPCTFEETTSLSAAGNDDDLLDCLGCQIEEAALGVGRDLHGAHLCCVGGSCREVLTRAECRRRGGRPARYRIDSVPTDVAGPHGLGIGPDGSLYIADSHYARIKKVTPDGTVSIVGPTPYSFPTGVDADADGNVYVSHRCAHQVVRIAPGGATTVVAGTGTPGHAGDGGPATAAGLLAPDAVVVGPGGVLYITESGLLGYICGAGLRTSERIRMVDAAGNIHTIAGRAAGGNAGEGGPALNARMSMPYGIWSTVAGELLIGEAAGQRVLRLDSTGNLVKVAGLFRGPIGSHSGYGGPARQARFYENCGVSEDPDGNVIIGPMTDNRVALVDRLGSVIGIAGTGEGADGGTAGDGGLAIFAQAGCPEDVAVAPDGRIFFADLQSNRIRVLTRELF
jgi:hypothetical protein